MGDSMAQRKGRKQERQKKRKDGRNVERKGGGHALKERKEGEAKGGNAEKRKIVGKSEKDKRMEGEIEGKIEGIIL